MNRKTISLNRSILFAVLVGVSLAPLGCAPTLVGENAAIYSMGKLHARVDSDMDSVYEASITALEQLQITVTEKKKDVFAARVFGKTSDGQSITIRINPETETSTTISIYTGILAKETRARTIYEKIREVLGPADDG